MHADIAEIHARGVKKRRSRVRPFDGRYVWGKRRLDLIASLTAELQREPSIRDAVLISNTAAAVIRLEQLQDKVVRGEDVDDEALSRATNIVTRLITALGAKPMPAKSAKPAGGLGDLLRDEHERAS